LWTKKGINWIGFLLLGGGGIRPNFIGIEPPLIKLQKASYTVHGGLLVGKKSRN